jgi:uridine kinase
MTRAEVVETLADLIDLVRVDWSTRVAVDGPDAAGKTTLADSVASNLRLRGRTVLRATVDDFQRPRAERYRRGKYSSEGYYRDSFDYSALKRLLLEPLGPGGDSAYRTATFDYLRDSEQVGAVGVAPPNAVLIVDGVFLLRPELAAEWDLSVFVSVTADETLRRALIRDTKLFGSTEEVERRYRERYIPAQSLYFEEARPTDAATIIVANDDPAHPSLRASRRAS